MALGLKRSLGCTCVKLGRDLCPVHVLGDHKAVLHKRFERNGELDKSFPLFPDELGRGKDRGPRDSARCCVSGAPNVAGALAGVMPLRQGGGRAKYDSMMFVFLTRSVMWNIRCSSGGGWVSSLPLAFGMQ
eukprot:3582811-Amphidinium_carterae.1